MKEHRFILTVLSMSHGKVTDEKNLKVKWSSGQVADLTTKLFEFKNPYLQSRVFKYTGLPAPHLPYNVNFTEYVSSYLETRTSNLTNHTIERIQYGVNAFPGLNALATLNFIPTAYSAWSRYCQQRSAVRRRSTCRDFRSQYLPCFPVLPSGIPGGLGLEGYTNLFDIARSSGFSGSESIDNTACESSLCHIHHEDLPSVVFQRCMANPSKPLPPIVPPMFTMVRRRGVIACTNCRRRKIKCLTPDDPPKNPCQRCVKKGLKCEYLRVVDQDDELPTPTSSTQTPQFATEGHRSAPPTSAQYSKASHSGALPIIPQFYANPRMGPPNPGSSSPYPSTVPTNTQYSYPPYPTESVGTSYRPSNPTHVYNRAPVGTSSTFYSDAGAHLSPGSTPGYGIDRSQSQNMGTIPAPYALPQRTRNWMHKRLECSISTHYWCFGESPSHVVTRGSDTCRVGTLKLKIEYDEDAAVAKLLH
ncbi:hypothetical protein C8R44DRAFT_740282 [Mycena epipterygia]|nr:hypothetical protein C8R44DRAFT_740282 [Mycena epipterygia]